MLLPSDRAVVWFVVALIAALVIGALVRGHARKGQVMTYSTSELREKGIAETILEWRRWRREMCLTQAEAAAMLGLGPNTVRDLELGRHRPRRATLNRLRALMDRWDESRRPARKPDRRGAHNRGKPWGNRAKAQPTAA